MSLPISYLSQYHAAHPPPSSGRFATAHMMTHTGEFSFPLHGDFYCAFLGGMSEMHTLFASRWLSVHRIEHWEFVKRPNSEAAVGILAITEEQEIILVEQYRIPMQKYVIEIPAGLVGDEPEYANESLAETASRELMEETGYLAEVMEHLMSSPTSAGMTSETTHLFHAHSLKRIAAGGGVAGEKILIHHVKLEHLRDWLTQQEAAGKLVDFKIHAALLKANVCFK